MQTPTNPFKQALAEKRAQIGLWLGLADAYSTEICAGAGFDWLLIDGEHSPNGLRSVLQQAQAIAAYPGVNAIARVPVGHGNAGTALIKQYLDLGVQTLLVPMVDTPEQASAIVRAMRYPPQGIRGMGGARASRWGRYPAYTREANRRSAFWCRPSHAKRWRTWTRSPPSTASMASSSGRPTCRPRSAMSATRTMPRCRRPSTTRSHASSGPARQPAS